MTIFLGFAWVRVAVSEEGTFFSRFSLDSLRNIQQAGAD